MRGYSVIAMRRPCGCVLGGKDEKLCAEAVRLFSASVQAEWDARCGQTWEKWERSAAAKKAYVDHFISPIGKDGKA